MKIAICDDELCYRTQIEKNINDYCAQHNYTDIAIYTFSNGYDLYCQTEDTGNFDIYILDTIMPEINGIELGLKLRQSGYKGKIIYLTSSPEYAVDSYKVKAENYLLKPIKKIELLETLEKIIFDITQNENKSILIKTKENNILVSLDNILYIELYKRTLNYYLTDGRIIQTITIRTSFTKAIQELLSDCRFVQCGQNIVVNLQHITSVGNEEIVFKNSSKLYFNRKICRDIRFSWSEYWFNKGGIQ